MTRSPGCTCPSPAGRRWQPDGVCATCGHRVLESQLTPVLLQILCGGTGLVLWRNARGYDADRKIRYGVGDGGADYIGIYQGGRFVGVEFKSATGSLQPNQRAFEQLVTHLQGVYAVVRCEADCHRLLERLRGLPCP